MSCPVCSSTQILRKSNVVLDVNFGAGRMIMSTSKAQRWLRCTLDICGGCGRLTTYVQDWRQWLNAVGVDAVFDTSVGAGADGDADPDTT